VPEDSDAEPVAAAYRHSRLSSQLARAWALCAPSGQLEDVRAEARFYEEVRIWMAKLDAEDRQSRGEPIPEDIQRLLGALIAKSTETGEMLDIYEAAGMPKPSLMDLGPDCVTKAQHAENPHLAIEALRDLVAKESVKATGTNTLRQQAFSDRIAEVMQAARRDQARHGADGSHGPALRPREPGGRLIDSVADIPTHSTSMGARQCAGRRIHGRPGHRSYSVSAT
jgi:type I restriction enzyme R subunit